ncbi:MAG: nucleotidyltransferase family protein [Syntrophomonadaceae bacterium]|nr:nucleotidyltransferase family protein [Syntrophomonadaceae bacterium]
MKIAGLTAEFNPLHNGHYWLLKQAREQHGIDAVICVMSGSFLQRGEAAVCSKWTRAQMAVQAGCDLVIELPFCLAVRSAWYFARGAVSLLGSCGLCTHLLFGAEDPDLRWMQPVAALLAEESPRFKAVLKEKLSQGQSFAAARASALEELIDDTPALGARLARPNNILALEYLRALKVLGSPLEAMVLPRQEGNCHMAGPGVFADATDIRLWLTEPGNKPLAAKLRTAMPPYAYDILQSEIAAGCAPLHTQGLSLLLLERVRSAALDELKEIYEMDEGLEYRMKKAADQSGSYEELRQAIKSRRYSLSRINRLLLYTLLRVKAETMTAFDAAGPQYLHVLAFSALGRELMKSIKTSSALPLLTRGSAVKAFSAEAPTATAQAMLQLDIKATDLHALLNVNERKRLAGRDFTTSAVYG